MHYQTHMDDDDSLLVNDKTGITPRYPTGTLKPHTRVPLRTSVVAALSVMATLVVVLSIAAVATVIVMSVMNKKDGGAMLDDGGNTQLYFAIVGDYGRQGQHRQVDVAQQMGEWCSKKTFRYDNGRPLSEGQTKGRCDFIIGVGDNFYENGVQSLDDPLFKESFEDIYRIPGLHSTRMYQILGNHDYRQRTDIQISYTVNGFRDENSPQFNDRWYMPSNYYSEVVTVGGGNSDLDPEMRVLMVFMDTSPMINKYYNDSVTNQTALHSVDVPQQVQWVRETLDRHPIRKEGDLNHSPLAVDYKIVIGHHPMYSCSYHLNNPEVIGHFEKMFLEKEVLAYIGGHDHNLQYILKDGEKLHHFISGAGSETRPLVENCESPLKFGTDDSGFMFARLNKRNLHIDMVNYKGESLKSYTIENPFNINA